jgi:hypothetical protein
MTVLSQIARVGAEGYPLDWPRLFRQVSAFKP